MACQNELPDQPRISRRGVLGGAGALATVPAAAVLAQNAGPVRIGVLTDLAAIMADFSGNGTVASITMAVEDFGGSVNGRPIEVLRGDHQNKPDIGLGIARQWFDSGVGAIFDVGITSVALGCKAWRARRTASSSSSAPLART